MEKKRFIIEFSNIMIRDFYAEWLSETEILFKVKMMTPNNPIEKRILQRVACLVGWFIKIQEWKFVNQKLEHLLSLLRK